MDKLQSGVQPESKFLSVTKSVGRIFGKISRKQNRFAICHVYYPFYCCTDQRDFGGEPKRPIRFRI